VNPGRYNLNIYTGVTFELKPVWKIGGIPVILSGYTADMQVRYATDTDIVVELSTANGRITIDAAYGQINLKLTASQTAALTAGNYQYDLNLTDTDTGTVYKILQGAFTVIESVTQ
jgi:hypothetical protein